MHGVCVLYSRLGKTAVNRKIFAELDKPKRKISKINLTSMQVIFFSYVFRLGVILNE